MGQKLIRVFFMCKCNAANGTSKLLLYYCHHPERKQLNSIIVILSGHKATVTTTWGRASLLAQNPINVLMGSINRNAGCPL